MPAPKGNEYWRRRLSTGRKPAFNSPEEMLEKAIEYIEWVEENPLVEERVFSTKNGIVHTTVHKMRAMTYAGLYIFLGISKSTWIDYKKDDDFSTVIKQIENIFYEQKFTGAAADLLNANIISRDLGLADKKELSGPDGGAIRLSDKLSEQVPETGPKGVNEAS